jgi:DNA-binding response OmpR family regulator
MVTDKRISGKKMVKVLVIESDIDLRHILSELFDLEGYEFVIHAKSSDIVNQVFNYQPDVVLLDHRLPLVDGEDLCGSLKHSPQTSSIPIIVYSVVPASSLSQVNIQYDAFIAKPFDLNDLLLNITNLVA